MIKKAKMSLVLIILCFLLYWGLSIAVCEWRTFKYGKEFYGLDEMTNMLNASETVKVLSCSRTYAVVYYRDRKGGDIIEFIKENNEWVLYKWQIIWSRTGSAEGFMWPYIR